MIVCVLAWDLSYYYLLLVLLFVRGLWMPSCHHHNCVVIVRNIRVLSLGIFCLVRTLSKCFPWLSSLRVSSIVLSTLCVEDIIDQTTSKLILISSAARRGMLPTLFSLFVFCSCELLTTIHVTPFLSLDFHVFVVHLPFANPFTDYYQDVIDHLSEMEEQVKYLSEWCATLNDYYLNSQNYQMNQVIYGTCMC